MSEQLRAAFETLMSEMEEPPAWTDLEDHTGVTSPPKRRPRGPIVAVSAAVVTLIVIGLVGFINDGPTQGPAEALQWSERESWPLELRSDFAQVWTGSEFIVWGGLREDTSLSFASGARYDPEQDRWSALAASPLAPRSEPVAVWTGAEVIYWAGYAGDGDEPETVVPLTDGAAYNPDSDTWRTISPSPLEGAHPYSAVWTGDSMVVVGPAEDDVARYDPILDAWTPLPSRPPLSVDDPFWISMFWTGNEVVVAYSDTGTTDVMVYTPGDMTWRVMPPSPFTSMDLPVSAGSAVQALSDTTLWLLGFAPSTSGLVGVDINTEDWVVSQPLPAGSSCSTTQSLLATPKGLMVESCGVAKILRPDGTWEGFPTLPRTLPKIPGPQPILAGQRLILLEAGIEPGAANFPAGADPHLWVLDDH